MKSLFASISFLIAVSCFAQAQNGPNLFIGFYSGGSEFSNMEEYEKGIVFFRDNFYKNDSIVLNAAEKTLKLFQGMQTA